MRAHAAVSALDCLWDENAQHYLTSSHIHYVPFVWEHGLCIWSKTLLSLSDLITLNSFLADSSWVLMLSLWILPWKILCEHLFFLDIHLHRISPFVCHLVCLSSSQKYSSFPGLCPHINVVKWKLRWNAQENAERLHVTLSKFFLDKIDLCD